jgi:tRNA (guanine-N7-)-methyltransferase
MKIDIERAEHKREIKSFVLRARLTASQRQALKELWPFFGIDLSNQELDLSSLFPTSRPLVLEIGFGMGNSLIHLAETNPDCNFIGIEVHKPGVSLVLSQIAKKKLTNLRLICSDAINVLQQNISDESLSSVLLFFPDPWPKRRHHKRRIVQPHFVDIIHRKLQKNGYFHLATDVNSYALHMEKTVKSHQGFTIIDKNPSDYFLERPKTKFELRGEKLGHSITDLIFQKTD